MMRMDKRGVGDSGGGPCSELDYETELADHRAALAALYARDGANGTGKGQRVDVPMIDAYAANSLADMICVDSFVPNDMPDPVPLALLRTSTMHSRSPRWAMMSMP